MRGAILLLSAAALAGCAAASGQTDEREARSERELAAVTAGRVAEEPVRCIDPKRFNGPQIISPDTLVYRDVRVTYTMKSEGCRFLDDNDVVIAEINGTDFCRNDRFRTLQRGTTIPGPYCRVGMFTPWRKPAS